MLDIRLIRENPEIVKNDLKKRGQEDKIEWVDDLLKKDAAYRKQTYDLQNLKHSKNTINKEIAQLKKEKKDISAKIKELKELPKKIDQAENRIEQLKDKIVFYMMRLPNILHESVPVGKDENDNQEIKTGGKRPKLGFPPKAHADICEELNLIDLERAAKVAGSRFYYLNTQLTMLDIALQKFALDFMHKKGYKLTEPPFMIKRKPMEGAVTLADFEDVLYKVEGEDLYLVATSEHSLAALHMDETIDIDKAPLKYAGVSPCFRKEAGSHGKDTKGIFRVHQFNKIEQFIFCHPKKSWELHKELIKNAEEIFLKLGLPYRIVNVCTGDMGSVAAKKYDLEVWFPAQGKYREMVSCSNCTSYQARKLNIKIGKEGGEKVVAHTLNSTVIATSRAICAILENFQQKDGTILVPKVLHKYLPFKKIVKE